MTLDSLSAFQSLEGIGRTDPSVTVVAFRTDASTVLERLTMYEIKKARSSARRNLLVKRYRDDNEAVARGRRKDFMCKGEVKLCLTGSGLEGLCW
jgi:hypothetical protein